MSEYIIDMGNSSYKPSSGLLCADVSQLREEVIRCRDCKHRAGANVQAVVSDLCMWLEIIVKPDGFCAWGEKR